MTGFAEILKAIFKLFWVFNEVKVSNINFVY